MFETIEKMWEVAAFLGDTNENETLDVMQNALEKKEYLISFMGQFSAGKSKLINNILQKQILPVHITETTAVITMIRFGETEYAEITYKNGQEEIITVDESQQLWQSGNSDKLADIEAITIYLPNDLLRNGLIIVDTPGINTIIDSHVQLTTELLNRSEKVIYVMGKPMTDADMKFIRKIEDCGISMLFVRTHMDSVIFAEETLDEVLNKEKALFEGLTTDPVFFVSNEQENHFFHEIDALRDYLQIKLADNVQASLENSCRQRIALIAAKFYQELTQQRLSFQQLTYDKTQEYNESKKKITDVMSQLDQQMEKRAARSSKICQEAEKEAEEEVQKAIQKTESSILNSLQNIPVENGLEQYEEVTKDCISECCHKIQNIYMNCMEHIVGDAREEFKEILKQNFPDSELSSYVPETIEETQEQLWAIEEVMEKQEQYAAEQEETDARINELKENAASIENEVKIAAEKRAYMEQTLKEYPAYEARYRVVQEASHKNEARMKTIGNILDFATILIPGSVFTKIGAKAVSGTAKIASKVGVSAGKLKKMENVAKTLQNSSKVIIKADNVDHILDMAKAGQKLTNAATVYQEKKNSPLKILDYLTFEYYFTKIGKHFDQDEITEVDKEYENAYYDKKSELEKQVDASVQEEMSRRIAMNQNMSEIRRLEMEKRLRQARQTEAERELKKVKARIEKEKAQMMHKKICDFYAKSGSDAVYNFADELKEKMKENFSKYVELYTASESVSIMQKLAEQKHKLELLESEFKALSPEQVQKKKQDFQTNSDFLKSLMAE